MTREMWSIKSVICVDERKLLMCEIVFSPVIIRLSQSSGIPSVLNKQELLIMDSTRMEENEGRV